MKEKILNFIKFSEKLLSKFILSIYVMEYQIMSSLGIIFIILIIIYFVSLFFI